jgi:cell division protein FtsB
VDYRGKPESLCYYNSEQMVVYRHKIWLKHAQSFVESKHFESLKLVGLFLGLFCIVLLFGLKITSTINKGLETQRRTDRIAAEVKALEQENENLKYTRDLYNSEAEIEAQYRELENKKKPGESVYIVSLPQKQQNEPSQESSSASIPESTPVLSNWELWLSKIFR